MGFLICPQNPLFTIYIYRKWMEKLCHFQTVPKSLNFGRVDLFSVIFHFMEKQFDSAAIYHTCMIFQKVKICYFRKWKVFGILFHRQSEIFYEQGGIDTYEHQVLHAIYNLPDVYFWWGQGLFIHSLKKGPAYVCNILGIKSIIIYCVWCQAKFVMHKWTNNGKNT